MAQFNSDNLNPEEEVGGFQAGEQGDESFQLEKLDKNLGAIPEPISSDDKLLYDSMNDEVAGVSAPSDSIDDGNESIADTDQAETIESESEAVDEWSIVDDTESDILGQNEDDSEEDLEDSAGEEDPYESIFGDEPIAKSEINTTSSSLSDSGVSDDLKDIINSELERSKSRKEEKEASEDFLNGEGEEFEDIPLVVSEAQEGTVSELELTDIKADRPSTYGLDPIEPVADAATEENSSDKIEESTEPQKEEKKKRGAFFWPAIVGAAILLIMASGIGTWLLLKDKAVPANYTLYLNLQQLGFEFDIPSDVDTIAWVDDRMNDFLDESGKIDEDKLTELRLANNSAVTPNENDPDDSQNLSGEYSTIIDSIDGVDSIPSDQPYSLEQDPEVEPSLADNQQNSKSEIDNYIKTQKDIADGIPSKPKSSNKTSKQKTRKQKSSKASETKPKRSDKSENPFRDKSEMDTSPTSPEKENLDKTKPDELKEDPAKDSAMSLLEEIRNRQNNDASEIERSYTVQVFSTLSAEDATIWKNKLNNRKVGEAFISEHVIRDQVWYRVRVGDYPTREKALKVARKLGYSQVWVDRVK